MMLRRYHPTPPTDQTEPDAPPAAKPAGRSRSRSKEA